ncbi:MAG: DUF5076 domain-containing protein [Isosphaeraceae bacterium]
MDEHPQQLPLPPDAAQDVRAIELLRVWASKGKQHVSLATGLWDDPASWGIMLVDLARHVANAYSELKGMNRHEALVRVKEGFDVEWEEPTDQPTGQVMG